MANSINRRTWIKSSALMAGGLALASGTVDKLAAMPVAKTQRLITNFEAEQEIMQSAPPVLKARLFFNENPFGPSPAAKKAITDSLDLSYQYIFAQTGQLAGKIAAYEGLKQSNIMLSSGSSPLLEAAAMHYCKGGKSVITGETTYDDLPSHAVLHGAKLVKVPLTKDYKLDLDAIEAKVDDNTGIIYICNPNNPTATVVDAEKLKAFCERVSKKTMVFIDEAYIDYLDDPKSTTLIGNVKAGQNIIVSRTFSKLYGFAGLRCGYIVAQPATIGALSIYGSGSGNLSSATVAAALAAYQETDFLKDARAKTIASRDFLYATLKKEGYDYIPSSANFVMFPLKMDGAKFVGEMMKRGVGVRNWKMNGTDWCRVSIGRMDEMEAFADAFKQLS
ncbi:histidinol-phosphate aminotransferase family protein [Mucilaginibacter sp. BJC16-A38]|uniref:pyridoxal phosphate-dependent aminotransferase n=1 Tax=Mucilaginibacter phenanthrenivorans TaxID=1234842 RepID=UPI002157EAC3|nr:histidinol-phosphate transaminase [Mucilaginibacter phenanthrenivorans]MCR8561158.1 histidinol-phosphate aminotransferase family protein [Mucilaginibacter phenanthrenivorans]